MLKGALKIFFTGIILFVVYSFGFYSGQASVPSINSISDVTNKTRAGVTPADFGLFWDAWKAVSEKYVDRNTIDPHTMVYGAIEGMVASLGDPYTSFFAPDKSKMLEDDINGTFSGIGAEIGFKKGVLTVITPLKNSPAEKAGLKTDDKILKIGDTFTADLSLEVAVSKIRGEQGTTVTLTIMREGFSEPKEFTITRNIVTVPLIEWKKLDGGVAYIQLHNFLGDVDAQFQTVAREVMASHPKKIIFDLRGNAGGFLDSAVEVASYFVPQGEVVAIEDFGSNGTAKRNEFRSKGYRYFQNIPLVVLIDGGSASAAEIVAGALKDTRNVQLVGEKTFGKGSVQEVIPLNNDTSVKITIAKWLTPSGASIHEHGIEPTTKVTMTESDRDAHKDPQLEKALEIAKNLP